MRHTADRTACRWSSSITSRALIATGSRFLALPRALRQLQQALPGNILRANLNRVELGQPDLRLSDHRPRGIAAGLDGIEHKLELPPEFRGDAYTTKG
jgi:hypothetical protein